MIRKVTKQHREEASKTPIYKVVRVEEGGRLRSLFITGTKQTPEPMSTSCPKVTALTYKQNRVISDGRYGIWCCPTLHDARHQVSTNGRRQLCRIYKVLPIGEPVEQPYDWGHTPNTVLYPAVIMGRCIETIDRRLLCQS